MTCHSLSMPCCAPDGHEGRTSYISLLAAPFTALHQCPHPFALQTPCRLHDPAQDPKGRPTASRALRCQQSPDQLLQTPTPPAPRQHPTKNNNDYMTPLWPPGQFWSPNGTTCKAHVHASLSQFRGGESQQWPRGKPPEKCPWRCSSARACLGASRTRTRPGLLPGLASNQCLTNSGPEGPAPQMATQRDRQKQRRTPPNVGTRHSKYQGPLQHSS